MQVKTDNLYEALHSITHSSSLLHGRNWMLSERTQHKQQHGDNGLNKEEKTHSFLKYPLTSGEMKYFPLWFSQHFSCLISTLWAYIGFLNDSLCLLFLTRTLMVSHLLLGHHVTFLTLRYGNKQLFLIKPWKFLHVL